MNKKTTMNSIQQLNFELQNDVKNLSYCFVFDRKLKTIGFKMGNHINQVNEYKEKKKTKISQRKTKIGREKKQ